MEPHIFSALPWETVPSHRISQLLKVAAATHRERSQLREMMDAYLRSHPTMVSWHGNRARLKDTPHLARYLTEYKASRYDRAIEALGSGTASAEELELVRALGIEIAESPLILRSGQVVLSGQVNDHRIFHTRYEPFLWATIHPVIAVEHAESQQVSSALPSSPIVYVLQLERDLPALFGRRRAHDAWELLLPRRLQLRLTASHQAEQIVIREALIGM